MFKSILVRVYVLMLVSRGLIMLRMNGFHDGLMQFILTLKASLVADGSEMVAGSPQLSAVFSLYHYKLITYYSPRHLTTSKYFSHSFMS